MNKKEEKMLLHYKNKIECRLFDEYDIYGFLILIRNYITKGDLHLIHELADTVAHSEKDKGIIIDNIKLCKENRYKTSNGVKIINYKGFSPESWNKEWKKLMSFFSIKVDKIILKEITLCIFSLFQNVKYIGKNGKEGNLVLLIDPDNNQIYLCTSEGTAGSPLVCFTLLNNVIIKQDFSTFFDCDPAETFRDGGILKLKNEKGIICEIN